MGSLVQSVISTLLGWFRWLISAVWGLFSGSGTGFFLWLGRNWVWLAVLLCLIGIAADLCVYWFRWQPGKVWQSFADRLRNRDEVIPEPSTSVVPEQIPE